MKDLLSTTLRLKNVKTGNVSHVSMPASRCFWENGEMIGMERAVQKLQDRGFETKQLTLWESFMLTKDRMSHEFNNDDELFNYYLRVLTGYNFSDVNEEVYKIWYDATDRDIEVSYL